MNNKQKPFTVKLRSPEKSWNRKVLIIFLIFTVFGYGLSFASSSSESPAVWKNLEPGLDMGIFVASKKSIVGDSLIRVLRADTRFFALKLLNSSASKTKKRYSVKKWVNQNSLVAGMLDQTRYLA